MIVCACVYICVKIYSGMCIVYVDRIREFRVKRVYTGGKRGRLKNREESNDVRRIGKETADLGGTGDEDNFKLMLYFTA